MFMQNASQFQAAQKIAAETIAIARRSLDQQRESGGQGLLSGSLVETVAGWCRVETLTPGTRVATYDGGFCPLTGIEHRRIWPVSGAGKVHVPGGALDNCSGFSLLPGQHVLVASRITEEVLDAAGVLVSASDLVGYRGIERRPLVGPADVVTLRFERDEIVYVNSGTLVHCAAEGSKDGIAGPGFFDVLDGTRAEAMLALMATGRVTSAGMAAAA